LPADPFHRLFQAFRRDVVGHPDPARGTVHVALQSWDDVLDYCHHSANPVGELMLRLSGDWSANAEPLSNAICTALQITNFLQDLSVDVPRGRHYIPDMPRDPQSDPQQALVALTAARVFTQLLFDRGKAIVKVPRSLRLRLELRAIIAGGEAMLRRCDQRVFVRRPTLG
jgi:phytoene/squalene synthetase